MANTPKTSTQKTKSQSKPKATSTTRAQSSKPKTATRKRMTKAEKEALMKKHKMLYEVKMVVLIAFTLFSLIALLTDVTGFVGTFVKSIYLGLFSFVGFVMPLFIFGYFFINMNPNFQSARRRLNIALTLFLLASLLMSTLMAYNGVGVEKLQLRQGLMSSETLSASFHGGNTSAGNITGGVLGDLITSLILKAIGINGSYLFIVVMIILGFVIWTQISLQDLFEEKKNKLAEMKEKRNELKEIIAEEMPEKAPRKAIIPKHDDEEPAFLETLEAYRQKSRQKNVKAFDYDHYDQAVPESKDKPKEKVKVMSEAKGSLVSEPDKMLEDTPSLKVQGFDADQAKDKQETKAEPVTQGTVSPESAIDFKDHADKPKQKIKASDIDPQTTQAVNDEIRQNTEIKLENYELPPLTILKTEAGKQANVDKGEYIEKAKLLEETLNNFNVDAKVISVKRGPSITMFEVQLSPGVKVSKVVGLSDDIALNLATSNVRIAPIPGKAAIGIEVPNKSTSMVTIKEVLNSNEFKKQSSKLTIGLGKDISGTPIIGDLASMPHLLIAGATGSGKSVCVNTIISSILFNATPEEVKFLMIDPKVVELSNYNGIPHLILPVVTDPKKASIALNWAVNEMTRRYKLFAETSVRDMKSYNKKAKALHDDTGEPIEILPQIVVIIDELADLMMVAPNQVEDAICRLAQMARAAGIHLIVATQRPSVDVITGLIKANIPSRIAFSVSSSIDSRTIIDMGGAEKLLGKGDMLYYPVGAPKPKRAQGAFMSDEEVETLVTFIKNQTSEVVYNESILEDAQVVSQDFDDADEYLEEAIKTVIDSGQASASMMQRKFRVGYNRAARLIDSMEERGIVGPARGSKPREVLMTASEYDMISNGAEIVEAPVEDNNEIKELED